MANSRAEESPVIDANGIRTAVDHRMFSQSLLQAWQLSVGRISFYGLTPLFPTQDLVKSLGHARPLLLVPPINKIPGQKPGDKRRITELRAHFTENSWRCQEDNNTFCV